MVVLQYSHSYTMLCLVCSCTRLLLPLHNTFKRLYIDWIQKHNRITMLMLQLAIQLCWNINVVLSIQHKLKYCELAKFTTVLRLLSLPFFFPVLIQQKSHNCNDPRPHSEMESSYMQYICTYVATLEFTAARCTAAPKGGGTGGARGL